MGESRLIYPDSCHRSALPRRRVWIPHVKKQAVVWRTYISCNDTISVFLALEIIH